MDPNATLKAIREHLEDADYGNEDWSAALAQLVGDLDVWLSKGGLPPSDWNAIP